MISKHVRTWIDIDGDAMRHNAGQFFGVIGRDPFLMAVVKSNAYGHGLVATASALISHPQFMRRGWFGVDSIVEAMRLREEGITNPMLVFGYTLPERIKDAAAQHIAISISNFEALKTLSRARVRPPFHIKIDTGMHRQGFFSRDMPQVISFLKSHHLEPQGVYTHFAMAKDRGYPTYTERQFRDFTGSVTLLRKAGFKKLIRHAAASGGTLLFPETHLDMVRVGMGLYGYYPSHEAQLNIQSGDYGLKPADLRPVLSWKTVVGEVKTLPPGVPVGYDLSERTSRKTTLAVLPIGYWHGYDRGLSSIGEVLIGGRRRRVLGRVSMDMIVADVTDTPKVRVGDPVILIGRQGRETMLADEVGAKIGTSCYEFLTRINPLIQRIVS